MEECGSEFESCMTTIFVHVVDTDTWKSLLPRPRFAMLNHPESAYSF